MKLSRLKKSAVTLVLVSSIVLTIGTWAKNKNQRDNVYHDLELFAKIIEKVSSNYVDEVDTHKLVHDAIEAMLKDLDPHSQFLAGLAYDDLMMSTRGEFGGLGIIISYRDHYPTVISPIEGTPAYRAGIRGGDQIIEIEGRPTRDWRVERAIKLLRGEPGTKVRFKIGRPGLKEPIEYEITREVITINSVPYYDTFGEYGYIKVSNFARQTREEMRNALESLEKKKIKGLVIDLRSNPGGLLQAATEVTELFLNKDKLIVYTKGRLENTNQQYYSSNRRVHGGYPIIVLVNEASASASEIFAGALQDWDLGFIMGQRTYGKGTVQTVFSLSDSEAVKLTTARYYTPSGRSIDSEHGKREQETLAEPGEKKEEDHPIYRTASGRAVYGGGGIKPDLELEPRQYTEFQRRLERDALFFSFAVEYSTEHKIDEKFRVTDEVIEAFKEFLRGREFEFTEEDFDQENLDYVRVAILREITNKVFSRHDMYRVVLENDPEFKKALELLRETRTLEGLFAYAESHREPEKASVE